jgi:DNA-binding FadR family transcriptional regulator
MQLKAIQSQRLFEQVARQLTGLIRSGEIPVGSRLPPERDLSKQLGVSRPTVREAMIALELAGLVEVRVGSGIFVVADCPTEGPVIGGSAIAGPSPSELIEARYEVERVNAGLAAERLSNDTLDELAATIQEMQAENIAGANGDRRFHLLIAEATQNRALLAMTEYLWNQTQQSPMWKRLQEKAWGAEMSDTFLDDHRRLLDALQRRDAEQARGIMGEHIQQVRKLYFDLEER